MELLKRHISKNGTSGSGCSLSAVEITYGPPAHKYCAKGAGKTYRLYKSENQERVRGQLHALLDFTSNVELPVPNG